MRGGRLFSLGRRLGGRKQGTEGPAQLNYSKEQRQSRRYNIALNR